MEWYRQVQFIAAVPMPPEMADEFGTTVNGMWASPEFGDTDLVAELHRGGRRVLFSVPLIALVPRVYEEPGFEYLLDETCRDIAGRPSECGWYYWERKPVYAACIYSDAFRRYLLDRCKHGVDMGMDVVNLDEIMMSVGLMNRDARGTGFCDRCLARFRSHLREGGEAELADADDAALLDRIWRDDALFERYRAFHEREAFTVMTAFIAELRAHADATNPGFAISANVAYLGNFVETFGTLWGCLWGPHLEFILMENDYRVTHDEPHLILPRGKFAPWYRLGSAFKGAPNWICPSINVPRQLAGEDRRRYYELMFLEAYANGGRWGYYWWPGVDPETRRRATAPEPLKDHIRFIDAHRDLYEQATSMNDLAIVYLDGPIMRRPPMHMKYVALAQALAELGYQYDVLFVGDGEFNPDDLNPAALQRYRAVFVPEARDLGEAPTAALGAYANAGGELVVFSESPIDAALAHQEDGQMLLDFWRGYEDADRDRVSAAMERFAASRIESSDPTVNVVRWTVGDRQVLHVLDYGYDPETDTIRPATDVRLSVPWSAADTTGRLLALDGETEIATRVDGDRLLVDLPRIDPYAILVLEGSAR
ncbi:MAG TPA: hypothetical protein VLE71_04415 [Actinomycetota bacterium]|nr:hypothetical protein [Actinomycetota bacterium]